MPHHYHERPDATRVARRDRRPSVRRRRLPLWMGSEGMYGGIDALLGGVLPGGVGADPLDAALAAADVATPLPVRTGLRGLAGLSTAGMFGPVIRRAKGSPTKRVSFSEPREDVIRSTHDLNMGRLKIDFVRMYGDDDYELAFALDRGPQVNPSERHRIMSNVAESTAQFVERYNPRSVSVIAPNDRRVGLYEKLMGKLSDQYGGSVKSYGKDIVWRARK